MQNGGGLVPTQGRARAYGARRSAPKLLWRVKLVAELQPNVTAATSPPRCCMLSSAMASGSAGSPCKGSAAARKAASPSSADQPRGRRARQRTRSTLGLAPGPERDHGVDAARQRRIGPVPPRAAVREAQAPGQEPLRRGVRGVGRPQEGVPPDRAALGVGGVGGAPGRPHGAQQRRHRLLDPAAEGRGDAGLGGQEALGREQVVAVRRRGQAHASELPGARPRRSSKWKAWRAAAPPGWRRPLPAQAVGLRHVPGGLQGFGSVRRSRPRGRRALVAR
jgi:hypothetical protein